MMLPRNDRRLLWVVAGLLLALGLTVLFALRQPEPGASTQVVYLAPSAGPHHLWLLDPAQPDAPRQLTTSTDGVYDFDTSADGDFIAYAAEQPDGETAEIMLLDLRSGVVRQLTNCTAERARCTTPAFRPDGNLLAYQRSDLNDVLTMAGASRIWLLNLTTTPPETFPLFAEPGVLGANPVWSGSGERLAFYDLATQAVLVYHFAAEPDRALQALRAGNGSPGVFSPDGNSLVFPELQITTPTHAIFRIANLATGAFHSLTPDDETVTDDRAALWLPQHDGTTLVITRRYLDDRFTAGDQLYLVDLTTQRVQPLVYDPLYQHGIPSYGETATEPWIVFQRYPIASADAASTPSIWRYYLTSHTLERLVSDGFLPRTLRR